VRPENCLPADIVFSEQEIDTANKQLRAVELPYGLLRRIEFFASQFEFFELAAEQLEYKTKDNVKPAAADLNTLSAQETGKHKLSDLGLQTVNGLSVRAIMTCLIFCKALAYVRGQATVCLEDVRTMLPFVLHDKLVQNASGPFFEQPGNALYRVDKISWIRKLFDLSCAEYDRLGLDGSDTVGELLSTLRRGLDGVTKEQVRDQLVKIERLMESIQQGRKLHGPQFDDVLTLKYLHQRYSNYLRWLTWSST
jgi:MoxR-like ATPase